MRRGTESTFERNWSAERGIGRVDRGPGGGRLAPLCGAMLSMALRSKDERGVGRRRAPSAACGRSGVAHALVQLADETTRTAARTSAHPTTCARSAAAATGSSLEEDSDGTFTVSSFATCAGSRKPSRPCSRPSGSDIYDHALFAGNSSGDPIYEMELGGTGAQADQIDGDVYSGGRRRPSPATPTSTARSAPTGTINGRGGRDRRHAADPRHRRR